MGSLFSWRCGSCTTLLEEVRHLERSLHQMELEMVRWKVLAEERYLEIDRMARALERPLEPSVVGGFVTTMSPPETVAESSAAAAPDAPDFAQRVDEIFGVGLTPDELIRRQQAYTNRIVSELQQEREEIQRELQRIP